MMLFSKNINKQATVSQTQIIDRFLSFSRLFNSGLWFEQAEVFSEMLSSKGIRATYHVDTQQSQKHVLFYLSFCGTSDWTTVNLDLDPYAPGILHMWWYEKDFLDLLCDYLQEISIKYPRTPIHLIIDGHSLGGALAQICAELILRGIASHHKCLNTPNEDLHDIEHLQSLCRIHKLQLHTRSSPKVTAVLNTHFCQLTHLDAIMPHIEIYHQTITNPNGKIDIITQCGEYLLGVPTRNLDHEIIQQPNYHKNTQTHYLNLDCRTLDQALLSSWSHGIGTWLGMDHLLGDEHLYSADVLYDRGATHTLYSNQSIIQVGIQRHFLQKLGIGIIYGISCSAEQMGQYTLWLLQHIASQAACLIRTCTDTEQRCDILEHINAKLRELSCEQITESLEETLEYLGTLQYDPQDGIRSLPTSPQSLKSSSSQRSLISTTIDSGKIHEWPESEHSQQSSHKIPPP